MTPLSPRAAAFCLLLSLAGASLRAQDGFAERATGGEGGRAVIVRTSEELRDCAGSPEKLIIRVEGTIPIGVVAVRSNKTIEGAAGGATLVGNLMLGGGVENVIIRNLTITNPMNKKGKGGGDGVTIRGGRTVWVDHCTFRDCGDGAVDVTEGSDHVTVSWCKFFYTKQPAHRFTMLVKAREKKKHKNKIKLTLHHNWWAENCDQRMPAAQKARVHMYNNYFTCAGNSYCTNIRKDAELLSENNFYEGVRNPCYGDDNAKLKTSGNIYRNCRGKMDRRDDDVFKPPYSYRPDKASDVPALVRAGAGAR